MSIKSEPLIRFLWVTLLAAGAIFHFIGITQPFLGNFAQHQTDYATVSQRWLEFGLNPLEPLMRFMAEGRNRMFLGDIPITMSLATVLSKVFGLSVTVSGRAVSIFFFFLSLIPLKKILNRLRLEKSAQSWAILFYIFSPLTLIYGQAFLLEVPALCFGLFGFLFFLKWFESERQNQIALSGLMFSFMLGLRIYYAPVLLPLLILFYSKYQLKLFASKSSYVFGSLAILFPAAWQIYALIYGTASGHESSLQDNLRVFVVADTTLEHQATSFRYFLPIIDTFLTKIVTPIGTVLAFIGFIQPETKHKKLFYYLLTTVFSYGLLFVIAPRKFVEFDYYFMPLVPVFSIAAGITTSLFFSKTTGNRFASVLFSTTVLFFACRYSIAPILITPEEFRVVPKAAKMVREVVPPGEKIIAAHYSTPFLFYTDRDGWALSLSETSGVPVRHLQDSEGTIFERIERFKSQGASYLAVADRHRSEVEPSLMSELSQKYSRVVDSQEVVIFSLRQ